MKNFVLLLTLILMSSLSVFAARYIDMGDGTVLDTSTRLMWTKSASICEVQNWTNAVAYCDNLVTNGYSDWRLPSSSIVNIGGVDTSTVEKAELDTLGRTNGIPTNGWEGFVSSPFTDIKTGALDMYWSSTTYTNNTNQAVILYIYSSGLRGYQTKSDSYYVWPVRTSQLGDWYVATNGTGQGTSWSDATNNLQGAITACSSNYTVYVSNGTYVGNFTNSAGVTIRSKDNDPATVILNGNTNGRVILNTPSSWLIGCTVTNGRFPSGSFQYGAGVQYGVVSNCLIKNNYANLAGCGGGVSDCIVYNSTISFNHSETDGGGAYASKFYNSIISNNVNDNGYGGGMAGSGGVASNCVIVGNTSWEGGGTYNTTIYNSLIIKNTASSGHGGGVYSGTIYNSTISSNEAGFIGSGGGIRSATAYNCISWGNNKVDSGGTYYYSCGVGYTGVGTTTNDPLLDANYRLSSASSPCYNTGTNGVWTIGATDLDDNQRIWPQNGIVDMGAYEYGSQSNYPGPAVIKSPNMSGCVIKKFLGGKVIKLFK
jgi:hypothetical protein